MGWIPGAAGAWEGGRIWEDKDGRRTYVIRRQVAGTGWHVSELVRFIRGGAITAAPPGREEAAILEVRHKSGEPHRTAIGPDAKAAAERLRDRGVFSVGRFYDAIRAACIKTGIPPWTPGRFRHTLATRAVEAGEHPAAVAAFLGHKSPATLKRFYCDLGGSASRRTVIAQMSSPVSHALLRKPVLG